MVRKHLTPETRSLALSSYYNRKTRGSVDRDLRRVTVTLFYYP